MQGFNAEALQEKWAPILNHEGLGGINDAHKRMVTAVLLENQEKALREEREFLSEAPSYSNSANSSGGFGGTSASPTAGFDPVLISLIRRSMPNLVAYDLAGVQPMNGPTGLIFAMRSKYSTQGGSEALFDEANTRFSGAQATGMGDVLGIGTTAANVASENNPAVLNDGGAYTTGGGMQTGDAERLGNDSDNQFNEMAFSIEKVTVTAQSRALKAEYSLELAQDLKAIHGLNAEAELANILSTEILS